LQQKVRNVPKFLAPLAAGILKSLSKPYAPKEAPSSSADSPAIATGGRVDPS
jgi:hypothetical protein